MKPSASRTAISLVCGAALTLVFAGVRADDLWPVTQRFNMSLGVFLFDTNTTMRVDGTSGRGSDVNLEDDFGFNSQTRFRIDGYWRFLERHKLRFMYFGSRSSSTRTISDEIQFGDVTFPVDADVHAELDTDIIEIAYEYSFIHRDTFELAGTLGLHNLSVTAKLSAQASSTGGGGGVDLSSKADGDGPLPVIGLRAIWALNDRFYFDAQAQFFAIKIDNYDGSLQDYKISFVWQPLHNLGVGIGYNDFSSHLDVTQDRFEGRLRFDYGGALGFVTVAF